MTPETKPEEPLTDAEYDALYAEALRQSKAEAVATADDPTMWGPEGGAAAAAGAAPAQQAGRSRLTVTGYVCFSEPGEQPESVPDAWQRWLKSDALPAKTKCRVGGEWQPLDLGGVARPSLIVVRCEVTRRATQPTPEERKADEEAFLLIGTPPPQDGESASWHLSVREGVVPFARVRAGSTPARFEPAVPADGPLFVRCPTGEAICKVLAIPE